MRPGALDRRQFLGIAGLGLGTLAVAGAAGLTWRAVDGGVFATGTGPAYAAWDESQARAGDRLALVRAAVLAANAHNTQPWTFRVADSHIDLFADGARSIGAMDPLSRELDISLGCCLENLVQAGLPNGFTTTVTVLPDSADAAHVARVDLTSTTPVGSAMFDALASRHTNRGAYDTARPVAGARLAALAALVDAPATQLVWFTSAHDKEAFGALTIGATKAIIADEEQAADDFAWYRTDWQEIQERKDGITIDPSGQSPVIRALSKIVPVSRDQNNDGWLRGTRDTQIPTAAAFGALVVDDPLDRVQRLNAGRSWQRMQLSATSLGLAMQPLCQVPERIDRERSAGFEPEFTTAMAGLLPGQRKPVMTFRIGYPTSAGLLSPRRPAESVLR
ncbi:nitroreductase family protein [Pengzhenrongella sicca]|uniref:Tat pathway signal protein n=1 Tax=Pengzhenrongella sicca TaxID=2819238 RepID=A0A8A4Z9F1_9MICO|nr:hypothetical protein [Pengzhenrongella sicca]QTE28105.1 hypothetical protein J4E96_11955 [Pengzhenrongella sicca]